MRGEFLDTNVLVYAFSTDPRAGAAETLLAKGCAISIQGLNEFANVARRKLGMRWDEVREALSVIRALSRPILTIDIETHADGLSLAERHGFSMFDALMIASAVRAGCDTLWSEDMQDGMLVDERLRIINPFRNI
jgi:predicted nucleic acid-binding protein